MTSEAVRGLFRAYRTSSSMTKVDPERFLVQVPYVMMMKMIYDDDDDDDDDYDDEYDDDG